jgi:protein SCO1
LKRKKYYTSISLIVAISLIFFLPLFFESIFVNNDLGDTYGKVINKEAYNFSLQTFKSQKRSLSDFKGEHVYLFFGFLQCSGVCPVNLSIFNELAYRVNPQKKVNFLFISIDPVRDNSESLEEFHSTHGDVIIPLISDRDNTHLVAKKFHLVFDYDQSKLETEEGYQIQHAGHIYYIGIFQDS